MARKTTATPAKQTEKPAPAGTSAKVAAKPTKVASAKAVIAKTVAPKTPVAVAGRGKAKPATTKGKIAAPAPKPATVTLKHLALGLSESRGIPKRDAEGFVADLIGDLVGRVKAGAKVRIAGLGVIEIKDRPARMARNPATGEPVQVAASRKVAFRAAKELKAAL